MATHTTASGRRTAMARQAVTPARTPSVWLDRAAALLIAVLVLVPAGWTADFLTATLQAPANGPRTDLWAMFFGMATWLAFLGVVVGLAVAVGLWKHNVLARLIGLVLSGVVAWTAFTDVVHMFATAPESLVDEIRGRVIVGLVALSAAACVGISLAISATPLVQSLRDRWLERVAFSDAD